MPERLIIGLMSGTSVDGIDAAIVSIRRASRASPGSYRARVLHHTQSPWPSSVRARLLAAMAPARVTTQEICELNFLIARHFARAAKKVMAQSRISAAQIAAIGSHGQTLCHLPPLRGAPGSTLQLGDVSVIAALTGLTTVGNFRPADMALGGQGAPLVPWTDAALLTHKTKSRAVQNIGGIANVTFLPAAGAACVIAFDTGPGNMLIDAVVSMGTHGRQHYDRDGRLALRGRLNAVLFSRLCAHPYFKKSPPKSTGREQFGGILAQHIFASAAQRHIPLHDTVHTVTRLTAWSIARAYAHLLPALPAEVILCGGGADNPALVQMLHQEFSAMATARAPLALRRMDEFGIPNKAKEAASFALLAAATLDGISAALPSVTGAKRGAILGVVANPAPKK